MNKWNQEEIEILIECYQSNLKNEEISTKLNRSLKSINRKIDILKKKEIICKHKRESIANLRTKQINDLIKQNYTLREISDKTGLTYNNLTAFCRSHAITPNHHTNWSVNEIAILKDMIINGKSYKEIATHLNRSTSTISNQVARLGLKRIHISNKKYKDSKLINGGFFNVIKSGAKVRNLEFNITIEQIEDLFLKQNGKCALSGIILNLTKNSNYRLSTASLDRIDSSKGYIIENIQWIHKRINKIKNDLPEDEFLEWIQLIYNYKFNQPCSASKYESSQMS